MKQPLRLLAVSLLAILAACAGAVSHEDTSDPAIRARLIHALKADGTLDLRTVDIDVHVGVVTLSGIVRSEADKRAMARIARKVPGVEQVVANLLVSP